MNENTKVTVVTAVMTLFFLQSVTELIQSIYLIDLLNTELDENVLGLLFIFSTALLYLVRTSVGVMRSSGVLLVLFRVLYPFFPTGTRIVLAGLAVASALVFLPSLLTCRSDLHVARGVSFSVLMSVTFRSLGSTFDISSDVFLLGLTLGGVALSALFTLSPTGSGKESGGHMLSVIGLFSVLTLIYLAYGSPAVLVRWTGADYATTVILTALVLVLFLLISYFRPQLLHLSRRQLLGGNLLFFSSLLLTILINQTEFISSPSRAPVVVSSFTWYQVLLLYVNILLLPVLLIDLLPLVHTLPRGKKLVSGFLISELSFVLVVFMMIFSNTWGYVDPVSPVFRGLFWLPFLIIALGIATTVWIAGAVVTPELVDGDRYVALLLMFLLTTTVVGVVSPHPTVKDTSDGLLVMTYNIQQGVDQDGELAVKAQLDLLRQISPDIIALQESDTAKINTGNNDVVRYFADGLGFYSYYGAKTVMQTYGVAILSRYPILSAETFFTYSDKDEVATVHAQIEVSGLVVHVFVSHPDGSDTVFENHLDNLLEMSGKYSNVIHMGDFNWDENSTYYKEMTSSYVDTWRTVYPSGVKGEVVMTRSIDHIFVSPSFQIVDAEYIPPPSSHTDHPAYWVELNLP